MVDVSGHDVADSLELTLARSGDCVGVGAQQGLRLSRLPRSDHNDRGDCARTPVGIAGPVLDAERNPHRFRPSNRSAKYTMSSSRRRFTLVIKCRDTKGIVAAVSGYLAQIDASIVESNQFNDATSDLFFMRTVFRQAGPNMPAV